MVPKLSHLLSTLTFVALSAWSVPARAQLEPTVDPPGDPTTQSRAVAPSAPPSARTEIRPNPPGPGMVWVGGYYHYRSRGWVWVHGRWYRPPRPGMTFVPGHWESTDGRFRFVPGHWTGAAVVDPPARRRR